MLNPGAPETCSRDGASSGKGADGNTIAVASTRREHASSGVSVAGAPPGVPVDWVSDVFGEVPDGARLSAVEVPGVRTWGDDEVERRSLEEHGPVDTTATRQQAQIAPHLRSVLTPAPCSSFGPGEDWIYCYVDEVALELQSDEASPSHR